MTTNPYAPPTAIVADVAAPEQDGTPPPFFAVSTTKLIVMSMCTLGIYELFWFYKNWQAIKRRERANILPAPRAFFSIFYVYQCWARIRDYDVPGLARPRLAVAGLAFCWVGVSLTAKLPQPYWLLSLGAPLFFLPIEARANEINAWVAPQHDRNARFTGWNWVGVAVGVVWLVLSLIGMLLPPASE